ncbi:MAG TPA: acyl-CoA dehydrogenase family protein [Streptosporangiaceae bacterium]|nr:acyl-CoA dehydrogenase family protein [Streptosporangiaceae bacterium]
MKLDLTPEQAFFHGTTRQFLDDKVPTSLLRELRDDPAGFGRDFWRQGADLGWTSLLVSEADGGGSVSGQGLVDLALVAFEFGRYAAPGPLTAANVVTAAVARSGTADQKAELLPGLLAGDQIGSWAYAEPRPFERLGAVGVRARRSDGQYLLTGVKAPVEAAGQADLFLVTARVGGEDGGLIQLLVPAGTPGVSVSPMRTLDITRRYGRVTFTDAAVPASAVMGEPGERGAAAAGAGDGVRAGAGGGVRAGVEGDVERQLQIALVIQLAELAGTMDRALELTTEWLFNRYSFGRPLASYQALKHRFADMRAWLEAAHAMADAAAQHVQEESGRAGEYVSAAKSFLGTYALEILQECVQFHGGIGVTFEHDLHLYLRRATVDAQLHGTVADHRERLTAIVEANTAEADDG